METEELDSELQPVGLMTEEDEDEEADEEVVQVSFQFEAEARPTRPARIEKDFILLQISELMSFD